MGLRAEVRTYHLEKCKYCGKIASALYNGSPVCPAHQDIVERTKRLYDRVSDHVVEPLPWRKTRRPARRSRYWRVRFEPLRIPQFNMAISFLAAGTAATNSTAGTTNAPGIPAGCTNLTTRMYAFLSINGDKTASINIPVGWTKLGAQFQTSGCTLAVYAKWFATGDAAPSFTWTTTSKNTGRILAYNGLDLTTPEDATISFSGSAATTTPTSPTVTAVTMGACRLHMHARASTGTSTPDLRMVERIDQTTTSTSPAALVVDEEQGMASGALGTRSDTVLSAIWMAATLWLRPATPSSFGILQSAIATPQSPNTPQTVALPNALTSGSALVCQVALFHGTGDTISSVDYVTGSNIAFTKVTGATEAGTNIEVTSWVKQNNTNTTAATVRVQCGSANDMAFIVYEVKGAATSGTLVDTQGINTAASGTAASVVSGSSSSGNKLALAFFAPFSTQASYGIDTNYTFRGQFLSASHMAFASETREFSGGSTQTANLTLGTSSEWEASVIVLALQSTSNAIAGTIAAVSSLSLSLASGITKTPKGVVGSQSAIVCTLSVTHSLSPNHIAGQSAAGPVSMAAGITKKLSGAVAAQSALSLNIASGITKKLNGTVAAQSALTATVKTTHSLSPNVIAGQSAIGPLSLASGITKKLSGQVAAQSAIVSTLTTAHLLAGSIAGQSSLACALSLVKLLNGTVGGQSAIICDLSVVSTTKFLAGLISGQSAVTSSLLLTKPLAGSVASQSSISASLTMTKLIVALIAAQSNVQSSLTLTKLLSAIMPAQSAVTCPSLAVARPLSGSVSGQSSISSSIAVTHFITGTVGGSSHLSAALTLAKLLSGLVGAQTTLTCDLTILGTNTISGTISAHSSISAALATIKRLAGTVGAQSVITASITPLRPIKGTVAAQSSLSAVLALTKPMTGTVAAHSSLSGALSASKALSGHIDAHSSLSALLAASRPLSGSIAARSAISGGVSTAHYLRGVVSAQSSASVSVELVKFLSGLVAGRSSISGALSASRDIAGLIQGVSRITFSLTVMVYSQPIGRIIIVGDISPIRAQGDLLSEGPIQLEGSLGTAGIVGDISPVSGIVGSIRGKLEIDT